MNSDDTTIRYSSIPRYDEYPENEEASKQQLTELLDVNESGEIELHPEMVRIAKSQLEKGE